MIKNSDNMKLQEIRKVLKVSQMDVAKEAKVCRYKYQEYEAGKTAMIQHDKILIVNALKRIRRKAMTELELLKLDVIND